MEVKNVILKLLIVTLFFISCDDINSQKQVLEKNQPMSEVKNENTENKELKNANQTEGEKEFILVFEYPATRYEDESKKGVEDNGEVWTYSNKRRDIDDDGMPIFAPDEYKWRLESKLSKEGMETLTRKLKEASKSNLFSKEKDLELANEPIYIIYNQEGQSFYATFDLEEGQTVNEFHQELMTIMNNSIVSEGVPLKQE